MANRYPPEVHQFIAANVEGRTCKELAELTNREMGTAFTETMMHSYKHNHGLKSGTKCGKPKGWSPTYPEGMEDFIRSVAEGRTVYQIADLVNERYGAGTIDAVRVRAFKKNHGIVSNLNTRFKKGSTPWTKGKKQTDYMSPDAIERAKATRFQPGQTPANLLPVGAIVKNADGYLLRKNQMDGSQWERWEFLHRAVWEEHNGPIPEGMMVSFKNGDKEDLDIDNLMLISNAENLELHRSGLRFDERELRDRADPGQVKDKDPRKEKKMIGYLSGPITGHKNYRQQFARAAGALKEMGYVVINPAELGAALPLDQMSYEDIMKIDLELLASADYLVQLPGWERSLGANRELGFALGTDKIVVGLEQLLTKEVTLPWT